MNELGMDVDQMQALAKQVSACADSLRQQLTKGDALVSRMPSVWLGADSQRFAKTLWPSLRRDLAAAQTEVAALQTKLAAQIAEQQRASAANGVPGGGVSVLIPPGAVVGHRNLQEVDESQTPVGRSLHEVDERESSGFSSTQISDARQGVNGSADATTSVDGGSLSANANAHGEVGVYASSSSSQDAGGVHSDYSKSSFVGVEGDANASALLNPDGAHVAAGVDAFAGGHADAGFNIGPTGLATAGLSGSLRSGIGASLGGNADLSWDHVDLNFKIGATLGIGATVGGKVDVSPSRIVDELSHKIGLFS